MTQGYSDWSMFETVRRLRTIIILIVVLVLVGPSQAEPNTSAELAGRALVAAYPEQLARTKGGRLIWQDGSAMRLDDGRSEKLFKTWLDAPDLEDMFRFQYRKGELSGSPQKNFDPGRARNRELFDKMYGDCHKGEVDENLIDVVWLPRKAGQRLRFTRVNGAAEALKAVSKKLDQLSARFDKYLIPSAGTYNCRVIAGTSRVSAHGYGIAIDIALKFTNYWRWSKPTADGAYPYKNKIPMEIVNVFESHGFIWGGKWYHYDTMHFEYRPEFFVDGK